MTQRKSKRRSTSSSSWISEYLNSTGISSDSDLTQDDISRIYTLLANRSNNEQEPTPEPA